MIEKIFTISFIVFVVYAGFNLILYLPRFIGWFGSLKKQKRIINKEQNKLALIIPARNESKVIKTLFNSIEKQTYPRDLFDIYVVVKDSEDKTIEIAKEIKAQILVLENQKCKGEALDFAFKSIIKEHKKEYKGLIIVDADCILDERFIEEMNNSLASNRQVFQAKKRVKNYLSDNNKLKPLSSCANGLIWPLIDDMGNRYKSDHNLPSMTIGTGIMLSMDLVEELGGWPYKQTITEDMEFMNDCAIKGIEGYYNSYCIMYVEEALSLSETNKRRTRWLKGLIDSNKIYKEQLGEIEGENSHKKRYYVTALWPVFRLIGSCVLYSLFNLFLSIGLYITGNEMFIIAFHNSLIGLTVIYLLFFIMTIFAMACDWKNIRLPFFKKILLLFYHPIFYMGYIPIVFKSFLTHISYKWDEVERVDFEVKENKN